MRVHQISEAEHDIDSGADYAEEKRELELFIMNDQDLYRQMFMPIIMNLARKMKRGVYNHQMAPKLWQYWLIKVLENMSCKMVAQCVTHFQNKQE